MKTDEVIARTLIDQQADLVTCVPGFGGTQVFEAWWKLKGMEPRFSFHEEVAFAMAQGASIAGKRAVMLTKTHGLAKAANAVIDGLYMGTNGGLVLLVFDDKHGHHSDNIFNAEALIKGMRLPYHQPGGHELQKAIATAFAQSEKQKLPVALLLDAAVVEQDLVYQPLPPDFTHVAFRRDILSNLVVPVFAKYQYAVVNAKISGQDHTGIKKPDIPELPSGLPPAYAGYVKPYIPLFEVFKSLRGDMVFGDTGVSTLFALPPYNCVDACSYMGGSVPLAAGAIHAGYENTWAVTGDFSFIAAGHLGVIEAASKNIPVKVLIFKNDRAQTTGGQTVAPNMLGLVLHGFGDHILELNDPADHEESRRILEKAIRSDSMQIVVADFSRT